MNLHNAISKPNTQKILQVLADRGDLLMKTYGKQSVFVVKQDTGNVPSAEVLAEMDGKIEQLKERVQGVKDGNRALQNEFNQVTATPPTNTLAPLLANLQTEIQTLSTRLAPLRTGANPITPAERKQIDTDYHNMRKEWQKRRKWFKNLWGMIEEGSGMTEAKELFERLGIEEDDVPFDEDPLRILSRTTPPRARVNGPSGNVHHQSSSIHPGQGQHTLSIQSDKTMSTLSAYMPMAQLNQIDAQSNERRRDGQPPKDKAESAFEGSRSPPANKNLQHVPCKFYMLGKCQAGDRCQFSHNLATLGTERAPCKYFQKGNCKFGAKCALAHIMPDGRRVNNAARLYRGPVDIGGRMPVEGRVGGGGGSALQVGLQMYGDQIMHHPHPQALPLPMQNQYQEYVDTTQATYSSSYGARRPSVNATGSFDGLASSFNDLKLSSSTRTLGPLDAPLPPSLDSNGMSYFARHGPIAASVPSKFGFDVPIGTPGAGNTADYGSSPAGTPSGGKNLIMSLESADESALPQSPRSAALLPVPQGPDVLAPAPKRPHLPISSSFPARRTSFFRLNGLQGDDWLPLSTAQESEQENGVVEEDEDEGHFTFEEDFVPSSLQELLTPQERERRMSRNDEERPRVAFSPPGSHASLAPGHGSGLGTSPGSTGSFGTSPGSSRFGALFQRHHSTGNVTDTSSNLSSSPSRAVPAAGVIGSPLRSVLAQSLSREPHHPSALRTSVSGQGTGSRERVKSEGETEDELEGEDDLEEEDEGEASEVQFDMDDVSLEFFEKISIACALFGLSLNLSSFPYTLKACHSSHLRDTYSSSQGRERHKCSDEKSPSVPKENHSSRSDQRS
ncbi:hypothetical protein G7K_2312-t2 [Saitoella complicata NRRL Y-17804]|nr:hypothetical protein G7K_2312-t2 [Saitoella complicata NRRL Y-17804]